MRITPRLIDINGIFGLTDKIVLQSSSLESDAQLVKVDETFERKEPDVNQCKKVKIQIIFPLPG